MVKKKFDPLLCCIESIDLAQTLERMEKTLSHVRLRPDATAGDIELITRRLKTVEAFCGIEFDGAWKTLTRAKELLDEKNISMAILLLDRIKRRVKEDIVRQFEE